MAVGVPVGVAVEHVRLTDPKLGVRVLVGGVAEGVGVKEANSVMISEPVSEALGLGVQVAVSEGEGLVGVCVRVGGVGV